MPVARAAWQPSPTIPGSQWMGWAVSPASIPPATRENMAMMQRLKPTELGADWLGLKSTARKLGISQQTVLQKVKSGELEGVRVRVGRRVGWRIRLKKESYDNQPTLF